MIVDLSREATPRDLLVDVVVVGSGCGGATAARALAEAGRDVVVLEEGPDRTGRELTQRDGEMYDQLYMDRGGRMTSDLGITVLQGRVLGGGGVINASDVVPIPPGVLAFWREKHGLGHLTEQTLAPYRERALRDLSASRIADGQVNRANRLLQAGAEAVGFRGEIMMSNRVGCLGLGTCLIGCPANAKRNPRFVAIPSAMQAGARFLVRARAVRIDDAGQEVKRVTVAALDARGHREGERFEIRARHVVIAANAVATPQLLLRSGLGNAHVGRHLVLQPQLPVLAVFGERVDAFRGIPQAYAVTEFEQEHHPEKGLWGFRIEAVMGTPGIVASMLPFAGVEAKEMMRLYPHYAAALLLVPDEPSGVVTASSSGRAVIHYDHKDNHKARLREAVRAAARAYLAAGAERVVVPVFPPLVFRSQADLDAVDELSFAPATAPLISAHQQGSVRMATSDARGACDPDGRVYGTRGIYVMDSSIYPSSASSHTMAPILTTAAYLADRMIASTR